jgi:hypothetical protein
VEQKGAPLNRPAVQRQCASVFVRSFPVFDGEEITSLKLRRWPWKRAFVKALKDLLR